MTGNAGGPDTITMTMSAANPAKNFVAVATTVPTVTPLD
jgi:hypothetical protein